MFLDSSIRCHFISHRILYVMRDLRPNTDCLFKPPTEQCFQRRWLCLFHWQTKLQRLCQSGHMERRKVIMSILSLLEVIESLILCSDSGTDNTHWGKKDDFRKTLSTVFEKIIQQEHRGGYLTGTVVLSFFSICVNNVRTHQLVVWPTRWFIWPMKYTRT